MRKKALIVAGTLLVLAFVWQVFVPRSFTSSPEVVFHIEKGQGSRDVALDLQKEGLIWWGPMFRIYVMLANSAKTLQAGDYSLSRSMSLAQIAGKIASGDVIKDKVTIVEGWTLKDIGLYFQKLGLFSADDFWKVAGYPASDYAANPDLPKPMDFSKDYPFLADKPANIGLEGFLFPDTYEVTKGITPEQMVRKMLDNFNEKLTPALRTEIASQDKTIYQVVTMASIVEKEVQTKQDKALVAGILWKRINLWMPLGSCATIAYIEGDSQCTNTNVKSPYNTYLNYGLPVGPISNPGMDSIMAAIYPQSSQYLYFLSAPDGQTIFSKTLAEQDAAKAKYLNSAN